MAKEIKNIGLSKSKYCKGIQCPKILWMDAHMPEEAADTGSQALFDNGNKVGDLARGYFGSYELVEYSPDKKLMIEQTRNLIDSGADNIAEASFGFEGLFCAVDILHKNGDGWDIFEVKSSTSVKNVYIDDMAFQNYVLTKAGINVKHIYNMHINNQYVFHNEFDLKEYFKVVDCTDECKGKFEEVGAKIEVFRDYVRQEKEPEKPISEACDSPYTCTYKQYCWKSIESPSVFDVCNLRKAKQFQCYGSGIIEFSDLLKNNVKLNDKQRRQVETEVHNLPDHIDKEKIKDFLNTLRYPIYHLDFETYNPAIPEWEGCSPFAKIPFQYSLHIEHEDGRLEHKELLAKEGVDPRREVAERLCEDIPIGACSLAYNMSFEKGVIRQLTSLYADLADHLMDIHDNMKDLMIPFSEQFYYSRAMQGSYSIKYVLPALFPDDPELDYHNLSDVHRGDEASTVYANLINLPKEEVTKLRESLLKYCELDTYAMVKILSRLRECVAE